MPRAASSIFSPRNPSLRCVPAGTTTSRVIVISAACESTWRRTFSTLRSRLVAKGGRKCCAGELCFACFPFLACFSLLLSFSRYLYLPHLLCSVHVMCAPSSALLSIVCSPFLLSPPCPLFPAVCCDAVSLGVSRTPVCAVPKCRLLRVKDACISYQTALVASHRLRARLLGVADDVRSKSSLRDILRDDGGRPESGDSTSRSRRTRSSTPIGKNASR